MSNRSRYHHLTPGQCSRIRRTTRYLMPDDSYADRRILLRLSMHYGVPLNVIEEVGWPGMHAG